MKNNIPAYLAAITLMAIPLISIAKLTGEARKNFIESGTVECYRTQIRFAENQGVAESQIKQLCACTSTYMADSLSNQKLALIENGEMKMDTRIIQLASSYCIKKLR